MTLQHHFFNFRRSAILLTLIWLAIFVLIPHILVFLTSFMTPDAQHLVVWPITLDSYKRLWEPLYVEVLGHSVWLAFLTTVMCFLLGYPFAYIVARLPTMWRGILLFLLVIPFWTNSLIRTYAIKLILGNKGLINLALMGLGITEEPIELLYTEFAVVFGLVYVLLPFMILPLVASFEKVDQSLIEAAMDLGANFIQRLWHIVLPLTMPGIVAGSLIVFLPAMGMFYVADLLGGAKVLLVGNVIKSEFLISRNWPFGSAISIGLTILMALLIFVYYRANKLLNKKVELE